MPSPDWTWLIVGLILGTLVVPRVLAAVNARKG